MTDAFIKWWPQVQPGGLYFIEDLAESYADPEAGFVETALKKMVPDVTTGISKEVETIECMQQICVLRKKK